MTKNFYDLEADNIEAYQLPERLDDEDTVTKTYEGDKGSLPLELRNLLITLLRGPYLFKEDRPQAWDLLLRYRPKIREHLGNLYLDLVCDDEAGIAYIKQSDTGDINAPSLLNKTTYRLLDSVLIVELRDRLMSMSQRGQRPIISRDEIASALTLFDPASQNNQALFAKHVGAVIERFKTRHFLIPLKSSDYKISAVLKVRFNATEVEQMAQAYKKLIEEKGALAVSDEEVEGENE